MTFTPSDEAGAPGGDLSTIAAPEATASDLTWLLCDLVTGQVLTELPLVADETVKCRIASVEQTTFRLPVTDDACPTNWYDLLAFGRVMVVVTVDDHPTQGWFVESGVIGEATVPLTGKTLECCAERTNVPDYDAGADDDAQAAAQLCAPLAAGFGFTITWTPVGRQTGAWYSADEDRSILDALNELMAAPGGPEWRVKLTWADETRRRIVKTIEIGLRIGRRREHAVFGRDAEGEGVVESYTRTHSYAAGKGATVVIGVEDGSGNARPMTAPQISDLIAQGWPRWEERRTFTGIGEDPTLDPDTELLDKAAGTLTTREHGGSTWTVVGTDAAPRPGRDYDLGDEITIDIAPDPPIDPVGGRVQVRVIGWELDTLSGQNTPILWEASDG